MQSITFKEHLTTYEVNEEMKLLRTNVQFCGADKKLILVMSAVAGEGKSTVSLDLTHSLAELGKNVLLLDCDLRKSNLRKKVVGSKTAYLGLSHYLSGQAEIDDILCQTATEGVFCIMAGRYPPNPAELLAGDRMRALLTWARGRFDYVILDCAPLNLVSDLLVVAPQCDGAILVVRANGVPRYEDQNVVRQMERSGCPILGVVLNRAKVDFRGRYYRKYGYYYGGYGSYGKKKSGKSTPTDDR